MTDVTLGVLFAVSAAAFWGVAGVLARVGMQDMPSRVATAIATGSGFVTVLVVALVMDPSELLRVTPAALLGVSVAGLLQFPIGRYLHFIGIDLAGVAPAMTLSSAAPLFAALLGVLLLDERLTWLVALGTLAVVLGLAVVVRASHRAARALVPATAPATGAAVPGTPPVGDAPPVPARPAEAARPTRPERTGRDGRPLDAEGRRRLVSLGLLAATGSSVAFGLVHVAARFYAGEGLEPQVNASIMSFVGMVAMSLMATGQWRGAARAPRRALAIMVLAGALSSLAVFFLVFGLARAPIVLVSPIASISPLFVMALTHLFLRRLEAVTWTMVAGAVLTVAGVALVIVGQR